MFWKAVEYFDFTINALLSTLSHEMFAQRAANYAECVHEKGTLLTNGVCFLYCTKFFMNRPGVAAANQRAWYSGLKSSHCLNYLSRTTSHGIFLYKYGPQEGRRHYIALYLNSGLDEYLQHSLLIDGTQYYNC